MGYFPFFVDIEGKTGLIVGGGRVARHKISKLLPFKPRLKVIAPDIMEEILELSQGNSLVECHQGQVGESDINDADFVIAASDRQEVNAWVSRLCHEKKIPVNVVDDKEKCSFIFPSLINRGQLTVGISTAGASPEVAASIKNDTAQLIPSDIDGILQYLAELRDTAKSQIGDNRLRATFLKETARECMDKNCIFSKSETELRISKYLDTKNNMTDGVTKGSVCLVGAGCGAYDLITIRGINAVRKAQVLVYDDLIDERLIEYASESCEKIYVGKRSGRHSTRQDEINRLLVEKALYDGGRYVVRLKGGDPFVFGRAGEEIQALKSAGIRTEYIPGITSSIAIPGLAGIPVTQRGVSRSFHVITGHTSGTSDTMPENLETIAKLNGTLVFLMGYENLRPIADGLIRYGKHKDTPAAVIHGNTDNTQEIVKGTLADIADRVEKSKIPTPAVIVVGEVVGVT